MISHIPFSQQEVKEIPGANDIVRSYEEMTETFKIRVIIFFVGENMVAIANIRNRTKNCDIPLKGFLIRFVQKFSKLYIQDLKQKALENPYINDLQYDHFPDAVDPEVEYVGKKPIPRIRGMGFTKKEIIIQSVDSQRLPIAPRS